MDVLGTAAIFVLAAMLVGVGLLGGFIKHRHRSQIENLMLVLLVAAAVVFALLAVARAPETMGRHVDAALSRSYFGMNISDIFLAGLMAAMTGCMIWALVRLSHPGAGIAEARSFLLVGVAFAGMLRDHVASTPALVVLIAYLATLIVLTVAVVTRLWRRDGGASA